MPTNKKIHEAMWKDVGYNCWRFQAGGFTGNVNWSMTRDPNGEFGYKASFEKWSLSRRFASLDVAKLAVQEMAKNKAEELLTSLMLGGSHS